MRGKTGDEASADDASAADASAADASADDAGAAALALLRKELRDRLGRAGLTVNMVVARTGISRTTTSNAFNDRHPRPSWRTVHAVARAVGVDAVGVGRLKELWDRAGDRPPDDRPADGGPADGSTDGSVAEVGAALLEVHQAALPALPGNGSGEAPCDAPGDVPFLTPYLRRPHDDELRAHLGPALAGRGSVLAIVTGDSSTGKTRALYEALCALAPGRRLLRPMDDAGLHELLCAGRVDDTAVLWLNEAQRFCYGARSEEAAAALRRLLLTRTGIVAVGTLWTDPYWEDLVRPGTPGDPHSQVRALLESPATRRVAVPGRLSGPQLEELRRLAADTGDRRLADAAGAGAGDGRAVQHLSGGPALLAAFRTGPGGHFTPAEHALVDAAVTARALGHYAPLPGGLLAQAADGMLAAHHRPADPDWAATALRSLTTGERPDGRRTDIRRALTPLVAVRATAGGEPAYEPADYLEQSLRSGLEYRRPHPALWWALEEHTVDAHGLYVLAMRAQQHRFRKRSVALLRRAVLAGHPAAWEALILALPRGRRDGERDGAGAGRGGDDVLLWVAGHVGLGDRHHVRHLLWSLHGLEAPDAVALFAQRAVAQADLGSAEQVAELLADLRRIGQEGVLLDRDPVARVRIPGPGTAGRLLAGLLACGRDEMAVRFAGRVLPGADLGSWELAAALLWALRVAGNRAAELTAVAERAAADVDVTDEDGVLAVLEQLVECGETGAALWLGGRCAGAAEVTDASAVAALLGELRRFGLAAPARELAERAVPQVDLSDPEHVVYLVDELLDAGLEGCVRDLFARDPVARVACTGVQGLTLFLWCLESLGEVALQERLLDRALGQVRLDSPEFVSYLLGHLVKAGRSAAAGELAERAVEQVSVDEVRELGFLFDELKGLGRADLVERLARRSATGAHLAYRDTCARLLRHLRDADADTWVEHVVQRACAQELTDQYALRFFVEELVEAGENDAAGRVALACLPRVTRVDADGSAGLLDLLRGAGLTAAAEALTSRLAAEPVRAPRGPDEVYGLDPDGSRAEPWSWRDF
ncbi:helix-turn-helix domain-containing protein [Streptomyces monticola]|uniref:Helix-turn-helix domain-containing protein n=1 Tax=Streptomyces monticola TaxID=2666263 RepID=A0ABW2JM51_9ACTN